MKLNYNVARNVINAANEVKYEDWDLPVGLSLKIRNLMEWLTVKMATFEKERHKQLQKFSELDENGQILMDENGNAKLKNPEGFYEVYTELLNEELEGAPKLDIDWDKLEASGIRKTPKEVSFLIPFIEDW